jgi:hypothetical protein
VCQVSKNYNTIYASQAPGKVVGIGSALVNLETGGWRAYLYGVDSPVLLAEVPTLAEAVDIVWEARYRARTNDGKLRLRKHKA